MPEIPLPPGSHRKAAKLTDEEQEKRNRRLESSALTKPFVKKKSDKQCYAKIANEDIQKQYKQYENQLFPVCPTLKKLVNRGPIFFPTTPKTKNPTLNSIRKILSVRNVLVMLKLNVSMMVRCAHDENILQTIKEFVNTEDLTNLSRQLEVDYPDISEKLGDLAGEFSSAEFRYGMHMVGERHVYLLPDSQWFHICVPKEFFNWRKEIIRDAELLDHIYGGQTARTLTSAYPAELKKVLTEICAILRPVEKEMVKLKGLQAEKDINQVKGKGQGRKPILKRSEAIDKLEEFLEDPVWLSNAPKGTKKEYWKWIACKIKFPVTPMNGTPTYRLLQSYLKPKKSERFKKIRLAIKKNYGK